MLGWRWLRTAVAVRLVWRAAGGGAASWLASLCRGEVCSLALLDNAGWGAANCGVSLGSDGCLSGRKCFVADAGVADMFVVVANDNGETILAIVEATALSSDALSHNVVIDLTKRSANVDFTGVVPVDILRGERVVSALRDTLLLGALLTASETPGAAALCLSGITD